MLPDPTRRFSSRVNEYVRYRPSYPREIIDVLSADCNLLSHSAVADMGSGTGLLASLFLEFGCEVFGIEPNAEMRLAGEQYLARFPRFHSMNGTAEESLLPAASVDFVTAGQAFHWFDQARARIEFKRILSLGGWVALVWNERCVTTPFLRRYEKLLQQYGADYAQVDHRRIDDAAVADLFGSNPWNLRKFENRQEFDFDGVMGRVRSSSYTPQAGTPAYDALSREIRAAFEQHNQNGLVTFLYETKLYYGTLSSDQAF